VTRRHRALTIRDMGTKEMRKEHDTIPDWIYKDPNNLPPFTKGTTRMEPSDMKLAMDLFYDELGWERETGSPKEETYRRLELASVGEALKKKKLLP
jgi:aldehyde:ferredoxin oxidoreductase